MVKQGVLFAATLCVLSSCSNSKVTPAGEGSGSPNNSSRNDGGLDEPDSPPAPSALIRVRYGCLLFERIDLEWDPVPGADRYRIDLDSQTSFEVDEPRLRLRKPSYATLSLTAMAGDVELAAVRLRGSESVGGDMLHLRGRQGSDSETTLETIGCISARLAYSSDASLPLERNRPVFPQPANSLRRSGILTDGRRGLNDPRRLISVGETEMYEVTPANSFVNLDLFESPVWTPLNAALDVRSGVAATENHTYAMDTAGNVLRKASGVWETFVPEARFGGRSAQALFSTADGLWVLSAGAGSPESRLYFFSHDPSQPSADRDIPVPDDTAAPRFVFDGSGLIVSNLDGTGHMFRLDPLPGREAWTDLGPSVLGLRSIFSSAEYTFATGGSNGADIYVFERRALSQLGHYQLPQTGDLEILGFAEPYALPLQ